MFVRLNYISERPIEPASHSVQDRFLKTEIESHALISNLSMSVSVYRSIRVPRVRAKRLASKCCMLRRDSSDAG